MTLTNSLLVLHMVLGLVWICVFQTLDLKQGHKNNKNISCPSRKVRNCVSLKNTLVSCVRLDGTSYSHWKLTGETEPFVTAILNYCAAVKDILSHARTKPTSQVWNFSCCTPLRNLGMRWNLAAEINSLFIWRSTHLLISKFRDTTAP